MSRDASTPPRAAHFQEEKKEWNYICMVYPHKLKTSQEEASEEVERGQEQGSEAIPPYVWTEGQGWGMSALDQPWTGVKTEHLKTSFSVIIDTKLYYKHYIC